MPEWLENKALLLILLPFALYGALWLIGTCTIDKGGKGKTDARRHRRRNDPEFAGYCIRLHTVIQRMHAMQTLNAGMLVGGAVLFGYLYLFSFLPCNPLNLTSETWALVVLILILGVIQAVLLVMFGLIYLRSYRWYRSTPCPACGGALHVANRDFHFDCTQCRERFEPRMLHYYPTPYSLRKSLELLISQRGR